MSKSLKTLYYFEKNHDPIFLYEDNTLRWMTFGDNYIQTIIEINKPHHPQLHYLPALSFNLERPGSCLIAGAGGGGILHFIRHYYPQTQVTAIELNPTVIHLAKLYFKPPYPIIQANLFDYLKKPLTYEHFICDVYISSRSPHELHQDDFFKLLNQKIRSTVSINIVCRDSAYLERLINQIHRYYTKETLCIGIKGKNNFVLCAYKKEKSALKIERLYHQGLIERPIWSPSLGNVCYLRAWRDQALKADSYFH